MRNIFLFLGLLLASFTSPAQTHVLTLKLELGQEFRQYMHNSSLVYQKIMDREVEMEVTMESELCYRVVALVDSGYELEVWYERLIMTSLAPDGVAAISYSSDDENTGSPVSDLLDRLVRKPFLIRVSDKGVVKEISQLNRFMHEIDNTPPEHLGRLAEQFRHAFDEGSIMGNFGMLINLPEKVVGLGDTWVANFLLSTAFPVEAITTYTLVAVQDDFFVIRGNAVFASYDTTWQSTPDFDMSLSGDMISEIVLFRSTGLVQSASHIQDIRGTGFLQRPGRGEVADISIHLHNSIQINVK